MKPIKYFLLCFVLIYFQSITNAAEVELSAIELDNNAKQSEQTWKDEGIRRSILLYLKASQSWEKVNNLSKAADSLRSVAELNLQIGRNDEALRISKKSLNLEKKSQNIDGEVKSLCLVSSIYQVKSQKLESEIYLKKALKLSKNSNVTAQAAAQLRLGQFTFDFGKLDDAIDYYKSAYVLIENSDDKNLKAQILIALATSIAIIGKKKLSIKYLKLAETLSSNSNNKRGLSQVNVGLAFVYAITNEKKNALKYYLLAEEQIPEGVDQIQQTKVNNGISFIYLEYGEYQLAEQYLKKAYKIIVQTDYEFGKLLTLSTIAKIKYLTGDKSESLRIFNEVLTIANIKKNEFVKAQVIQYLGDIDFDDKKYDDALKKYADASLVNKAKGITIPNLSNKIGKIYEITNGLDNARVFYEQALKESRNIEETTQIAQSLFNLAQLDFNESKLDSALDYSVEALNVTESIVKDVGNHNLRQSFLSNSYDRYELHINILMKMHELSPKKGFDLLALKTSEKARSRLMRENLQLSEIDLTLDADQKLVDKEKELEILLSLRKEDKKRLLKDGAKSDEIEELNEEISRINNQLQAIKAKLRESSPLYYSIKNSVEFESTKFQNKILDNETVLVEFFIGKENSYVWLIEKNQIHSYNLPNGEFIEEKVDSLLKTILSIEDLPNNIEYLKQLELLETSYWIDAKELSNILFSQYYDRLIDKRIIIVPDGNLRSFPISALPTLNNEENTPFLLTNEIIYEPSAALLYLLKTIKNKNKPPQKDFLVFSDPIFDQRDERLKTQIKSFNNESITNEEPQILTNPVSQYGLDKLTRLFASKKEGKNIFQYYNPKYSKQITGFEANRKTFITENLSDYKVLHFATHGIFNEDVPELSGIVLSRFDKNGEKQNEMIWLQDIYGLKLSSDLVVLSACQTGVGKEIKGEGLMSLTNGFLQVGAKSIISSRWKVDDSRTSELMKNFYKYLAEENLRPSKALQKAKIQMYRKNPNNRFPFFWASFTFHGDFQNKSNLHANFDYSMYLTLMLLALGLFTMLTIIKNKVTTSPRMNK